MKKIVSILAAAALMAPMSAALAANSANGNPDVFVNDTLIFFDDQPAVIVDGRTLVPARGVFEAMGAKVDWDDEKRQVQVTSADEQTIVRLVIDDNNMKTYDMSGLIPTLLLGQDFHAPETVVELDVAPQIMNDRTMVPLRAISEAVGADVDWNGEEYCVEIETKEVVETPENAPAYSLSTETATVAEGETFDIFVNVKNIPEGTFVSGVTTTLQYNNENFEFVEAVLMNGDNVIEGAMGASNDEFGDGYVKNAFVTINADNAAKTDAAVMKITFKSINGKEGIFVLSDGYQTRLGYNTTLFVDDIDYDNPTHKKGTYAGDLLNIDTAPVIVNNETFDEPEITEAETESTEATETTAETETATETEAAAAE